MSCRSCLPCCCLCVIFGAVAVAATLCAFFNRCELDRCRVSCNEELAAADEKIIELRGLLGAGRAELEESQAEVRALRLSLQGLERDLAACQARAEKHPGPEPAPPGPAGSPPGARPAPPAPPKAPLCPNQCPPRCRKGKCK